MNRLLDFIGIIFLITLITACCVEEDNSLSLRDKMEAAFSPEEKALIATFDKGRRNGLYQYETTINTAYDSRMVKSGAIEYTFKFDTESVFCDVHHEIIMDEMLFHYSVTEEVSISNLFLKTRGMSIREACTGTSEATEEVIVEEVIDTTDQELEDLTSHYDELIEVVKSCGMQDFDVKFLIKEKGFENITKEDVRQVALDCKKYKLTKALQEK